jgi:hypothetical protein
MAVRSGKAATRTKSLIDKMSVAHFDLYFALVLMVSLEACRHDFKLLL